MEQTVKILRNAALGSLQVLTQFTLEATNESPENILINDPDTNQNVGAIVFELGTMHTGFHVFLDAQKENVVDRVHMFSFDLGNTHQIYQQQQRLKANRNLVGASIVSAPDWNDAVEQHVDKWAYLRVLFEMETLAKALNILYSMHSSREPETIDDALDEIRDYYDVSSVVYWAFGTNRDQEYNLVDDVELFFGADTGAVFDAELDRRAEESLLDEDEEEENDDEEEDDEDDEEDEDEYSPEEVKRINAISQVLETIRTEKLIQMARFLSLPIASAIGYNCVGISGKHNLIRALEVLELDTINRAFAEINMSALVKI